MSLTLHHLADRVSDTALDTRVMVTRSVRRSLRDPEAFFTALMLPVILMLLFVYVFGGAMRTGTSYVDYVVPGLIVLCAGFGAGTTATAVAQDMTNGIVDRFRSMPVSPLVAADRPRGGQRAAQPARDLPGGPGRAGRRLAAHRVAAGLAGRRRRWSCCSSSRCPGSRPPSACSREPRGRQQHDDRADVPALREHRVRPRRHDALVAPGLRRAPADDAGDRDPARAVDGHAARPPAAVGRRLVRRHPGRRGGGGVGAVRRGRVQPHYATRGSTIRTCGWCRSTWSSNGASNGTSSVGTPQTIAPAASLTPSEPAGAPGARAARGRSGCGPRGPRRTAGRPSSTRSAPRPRWPRRPRSRTTRGRASGAWSSAPWRTAMSSSVEDESEGRRGVHHARRAAPASAAATQRPLRRRPRRRAWTQEVLRGPGRVTYLESITSTTTSSSRSSIPLRSPAGVPVLACRIAGISSDQEQRHPERDVVGRAPATHPGGAAGRVAHRASVSRKPLDRAVQPPLLGDRLEHLGVGRGGRAGSGRGQPRSMSRATATTFGATAR